MKIEAINKGSEAKALAFQEFLGFTLPDDYFNFLAQNDGAIIDEAYFYVKDIGEYIMFELFYDIKRCIETYEEFSEDFPDKSLVIGRDPGGGMLLLVTEDMGISPKGFISMTILTFLRLPIAIVIPTLYAIHLPSL